MYGPVKLDLWPTTTNTENIEWEEVTFYTFWRGNANDMTQSYTIYKVGIDNYRLKYGGKIIDYAGTLRFAMEAAEDHRRWVLSGSPTHKPTKE